MSRNPFNRRRPMRVSRLIAAAKEEAGVVPRWFVPGLLVLAITAIAGVLWAIRTLFPGRGLPVREEVGEHPQEDERPPSLPREAQEGVQNLQLTGDGAGPLFHRRYRVDISRSVNSAESLMSRIQKDPSRYVPPSLVRFEKTRGEPERMQVGDEYDIHITGPWNGSVRVIDVSPTSFTFVTLEGHMEAGEIQFRVEPHPSQPDVYRFEILSWARSRDRWVDFAYDKLGIAREAQSSMWAHFCQEVVDESGGELLGEIEIVTSERPFTGEVIPRE